MTPFSAPVYNAAIASLIASADLNELGPGKPDQSRRAALAALSPEQILAPHAVRDESMAEGCLAGLWLLYDFLDESHTISQSLDTLEGSYWHGIMHRREPDYENAKYWFRRVPAHAIHGELMAGARELAVAADLDHAAQFLSTGENWDAFRFVDLCRAAAAGRSSSASLCRQVQRLEWQLLFAYCWRQAGGASA
ncbi:MAG TPA: hypothetical protein VHD36_01000 [Pirellulales bacterium]|nr:hypothetical protein [Pirellulales bacterium]